MIGAIQYIQDRGRNKLALSYLDTLPVLWGQLHEPDGLSEGRLEKRLERLENSLYRQGIRRVMLPERFPHKARLKKLSAVEVLPFYRSAADVIALDRLSYRSISPEEARIGLAAPRLSGELQHAAERLHAKVREVVILVAEGGEDYARLLHSRYGLPVTPCSAQPDVTVAFGPVEGLSGDVLRLYEDGPQVSGLRMTAPGLELPEDCGQAALALLWEYGRLNRNSLKATFSVQTLANEYGVCYNN